MCGIAGCYNLNATHLQENLQQMGRALAHRGPDAEGFFTEGPVGLVHRRLSIIDLSRAADQPMHSACGRYVMVFNGEVYNFMEIRAQLEKECGFVFHTHSDSEVVLQAFVHWGLDCVLHFNGMFAMAVYDRQRRELTLIRDRIGIKPLFVFRKGNQLAFASELKALQAVPEIAAQLTPHTEARCISLHLGYIPQPHTAWREIQKFPPGHTAVWDGVSLMATPYWSAEGIRTDILLRDENEALERLKNLLVSSVRLRLVSDVPFGTFLSGGIDSSLVTAIAQSVHNAPLNTFSIGFDSARHDESSYARAVAERLGTHHHEFRVSEQDALDLIPQLAGIYDEPFTDTSAVPTLLVSKLARQQVTMALSGDGGDELFMGYGAYRWAERLRHPLWKLGHNGASALLKHGNDRQQRIGEMLKYSASTNLQTHIFSQEQYLFSMAEVERLTRGRLRENHSLIRGGQPSSPEEQALHDLTHYLPDDLLVKVDRASMHVALEARVPLLDYRIVEFARNLDPTLKYRNGITKVLLKKVLYSYLPAELFDRPKWGFSVPLAAWMKGPLKPYILDTLSADRLQRLDLLDAGLAQSLVQRFYRGGADHLYNRVWAMTVVTHAGI